MLRRKHHEGGSVKCIWSGRIDCDLLFPVLDREIHLCSIGFADPVGLHLLNLFRPVQLIQVIEKALCIRRDLQHPLAQVFLGHLCSAALAFSIHHFLVSKAGLTGRTPVDREFLLVSKALLEHFYKDPLCPLIVIRVCGVHFTVPVIKSCDLVDLFLDMLNVFCCRYRRMHTHLNRIVFCRQAKRIPSHRMDNIIALLQLIPAPYIGDHVASPVSYMETISGRIWEHIQTIIFLFLIAVFVCFRVDRILFPVLTPFFFDCLMIIRYS